MYICIYNKSRSIYFLKQEKKKKKLFITYNVTHNKLIIPLK